eukprot:scpid67289/ scgid9744/ 
MPDVYSIPPANQSSGRWHRLVNRSIPRKERLKVQLTAVGMIFLLITGPVYWIHPPRFDLRPKRIAGNYDVRPGLHAVHADVLQNVQHVGQDDRATDDETVGTSPAGQDVLHLVLKLPRRGTSSEAILTKSRQGMEQALRVAKLNAHTSLSNGPSDGDFGIERMQVATARVLVDESWEIAEGNGGDGDGGVSLERIFRPSFRLTGVHTRCEADTMSPICCDLCGEFEHLLELYRRELTSAGKKSFVCVDHAPTVAEQANKTLTSCHGDMPTSAAFMPVLRSDLLTVLLRSTRPTVVAHTPCGALQIYRRGGHVTETFQPARRYPFYGYCLNAALLQSLSRKTRRLRGMGSKRLQAACAYLTQMRMGADEPERLGPVLFLTEVLRKIGV